MASAAPRQFGMGWIPDRPDNRDFMLSMTAAVGLPIPNQVDWSSKLSACYDQGRLGSCTANAIAGGIEFVQQAEGEQFVMPSRLFIYYNERAMEGTVPQDAGAQIRDGIKSVVRLGVCPEQEWPYSEPFATQPSHQCYIDAKKNLITKYYRIPQVVTDMVHCLAEGYPFVFGVRLDPAGFINAPHGDVPTPSPYAYLPDGHAILAVGYDLARQRFKFRNSWGTAWGDGTGHGTIGFDYLSNPSLGSDYWTLRRDLA